MPRVIPTQGIQNSKSLSLATTRVHPYMRTRMLYIIVVWRYLQVKFRIIKSFHQKAHITFARL